MTREQAETSLATLEEIRLQIGDDKDVMESIAYYQSIIGDL
jgi:hypothetical protein